MEPSFFLMRVTQKGNKALVYSMQADDGAAGKFG
jgi:hypothetical protein